jgi:hypothetical protein
MHGHRGFGIGGILPKVSHLIKEDPDCHSSNSHGELSKHAISEGTKSDLKFFNTGAK